MRFYKISQAEIKFAHIDTDLEYDDAKIKSEVREQLPPEMQEKCRLLAEIGALTCGQDISVSTAKEHTEPIVVPMGQPVSDALRGQPEVTDSPTVSPYEEQRKQQEELMRRQRQQTMGV